MEKLIDGPAGKGDNQTYLIIGAAMEVHRTLGPGFLEPVYQAAFEVELTRRGIPFGREVKVPICYKGALLGLCYRADFVCYENVLVELKALARISHTEEAQVINYLVASGLSRAILLNFGTKSLQFRRFAGPELRVRTSSDESVKSVDLQS